MFIRRSGLRRQLACAHLPLMAAKLQPMQVARLLLVETPAERRLPLLAAEWPAQRLCRHRALQGTAGLARQKKTQASSRTLPPRRASTGGCCTRSTWVSSAGRRRSFCSRSA